MPDSGAPGLWSRVAKWFVAEADHVTVGFLPDEDGTAIRPYAGYLRLWLAEGFLRRRRSWAADRFPVLHGGVSLTFLGADRATFTTFSRPPGTLTMPGAQLDFPITPLLPFNGGTVEVEAALYQASTGSGISTAIDLVGGLASLIGPPLATAAIIADKISEGLETVIGASGEQPLLGLHRTLIAPGGGGAVLTPGHVVVLSAPAAEIAGTPVIRDGLLHLATADGVVQPTGLDYMVVRIECRAERDDWRFPELDALIRQAITEAIVRGHSETFEDLRKEAIVRAWNSTDLAVPDRKRVALLVAEEIDDAGTLGIVPSDNQGLQQAAESRLADRDDPRLVDVTLDGLMTRTY